MHKLIRRIATIGALGLVALSTTFVGTASATHVACGTTITVSTTLDSDVGPCPTFGIRLGANNITLDLNGHTVFGAADPGQGAGIIFRVTTGSTVKNGEVHSFDAGVAVLNGSGNTVTNLNVHDNIGPSDGDFGDGIVLVGPTSGNQITNNQVIHNGPYDGIGMYGNSDNNVITGNAVRFNNVLGIHHDPQDPAMQDTGIRLENGSDGNLVQSNSVTNNGLDGIEIFAQSDNNTIRFNQVAQNGFNNNPANGLRVGDGINAFSGANGNTIQSNGSHQNAGNGIVMYTGATSNFILTNQAFGNNAQPVVSRPAYDLQDANPNCDNNQWHGNVGATFNPPCVLAP